MSEICNLEVSFSFVQPTEKKNLKDILLTNSITGFTILAIKIATQKRQNTTDVKFTLKPPNTMVCK